MRELENKGFSHLHHTRSLKVDKVDLDQSQKSNSLERADARCVLKTGSNKDLENDNVMNDYSSCKCKSDKMSVKFTKALHRSESLKETCPSQESLFFAARQKLLEKIGKTLDHQISIESSAKVCERQTSKTKILNMYQENRPSNYNRIGDYNNYCKLTKLNPLNDNEKRIRRNHMKAETKRLMKKIPQSILIQNIR